MKETNFPKLNEKEIHFQFIFVQSSAKLKTFLCSVRASLFILKKEQKQRKKHEVRNHFHCKSVRLHIRKNKWKNISTLKSHILLHLFLLNLLHYQCCQISNASILLSVTTFLKLIFKLSIKWKLMVQQEIVIVSVTNEPTYFHEFD